MHRLCGFNFLWMFSSWGGRQPSPPDERALDFMAEHGFRFVRVPTCYWHWTKDFDYDHPDEAVFVHIDRYIEACRQRGLHMSLNLHRGPGYCINANHLEKHNLWVDSVAQDAFAATWRRWAERWKDVPAEDLSFDLLNEPPAPGQYGLTREGHASLMKRTAEAVWEASPSRPITLDGLGGGGMAMPELASFPVTHSGRGYQPMPLTHWKAEWWDGWKGLEPPVWPGARWEGRSWDREALVEFYQPWREVEAAGRPVHMGEFGCFTGVDNKTALAWLADLLSVWRDYRWGWAMWNFQGAFGIVEHGREGAVYEEYKGYKVDRQMLDLLLASIP